jgi:hypothetical protein
MAWPKCGTHFSAEVWMVFDFQTEAGRTDGPTWVTLVEEEKMIFAAGIY